MINIIFWNGIFPNTVWCAPMCICVYWVIILLIGDHRLGMLLLMKWRGLQLTGIVCWVVIVDFNAEIAHLIYDFLTWTLVVLLFGFKVLLSCTLHLWVTLENYHILLPQLLSIILLLFVPSDSIFSLLGIRSPLIFPIFINFGNQVI